MDSQARSEQAVVVVGSVNVDLSLTVPCLPRPGETVSGGGLIRSGGGKGGNQAVAASRLGAQVWLIAEVGGDPEGDDALAELARDGVDTSLVGRSRESTGLAVILVEAGGENLIAVAPGANLELDPDRTGASIRGLSTPAAVVLACHEIPDECVLAAAEASSSRGYQMVLNAAPARPISARVLSSAQVVICNQVELPLVAPAGVGQLLGQGPRAVVVTLGAGGADLFVAGHARLNLPAPTVDVEDTTGAGDAFCGAFATLLAEGASIEEATRFAVTVAAISVRSKGARAGMPHRSDLSLQSLMGG
jgi:ribokinase